MVVLVTFGLMKNMVGTIYAQSPTPSPAPSVSSETSTPAPSPTDANQQTGGPQSSEVLGDAQVLGATGFSDAFKWVIAGLVGTAVFLLGIKISRTHAEE